MNAILNWESEFTEITSETSVAVFFKYESIHFVANQSTVTVFE